MNSQIFLVCLFTIVGRTNGQIVETLQNTLKDYGSHECLRPCTANALPKTCEYHFVVEEYHVLSKACFNCPFNQTDCFRPHCVPADGFEKSILTVNRMMPGPAIQVCKDDTIVIKVDNKLPAESTSLHAHGIHQVNTPHHDGAPMITQCPIHPGNRFTYRFKADPPGTHYWHSHSGFQRTDGLYGALIVREPDDPHGALYDHDLSDHVILVQDWLLMLTQTMFTGHHHSDGTVWNRLSRSMTVNGLGKYQAHTHPDTSEDFFTPRKVFYVEAGMKYRFRAISNTVNCPVLLSVDNHKLLIIASDGQPIEPYEADSVQLHPGERYDFVLHANASTPGNYWIRVFGLPLCFFAQSHQEAILRYQGVPEENPAEPDDFMSGNRAGVQLNVMNENLAPERIPIVYMNHTHPDEDTPDDKWNQPEADVKHYLAFDFNTINNVHYNDPILYSMMEPYMAPHPSNMYTPQVNHISLQTPPAPLLTQYEDIPEDMYCDADTVKDLRCNETYCECIHKIKVNWGDVMEIILIDQGINFDANHAFHIHGYAARVVGMERVNQAGVTREEIMAMDERGEIPRKLERAVKKDTVTVPDGGYVVLRFHATNPGFWLLHCHLNYHQRVGMAVIIQVGELSQMQKKPKNFPTCGHWSMEGYEDDEDTDNRCSGSASLSSSHILIVMYLVCDVFRRIKYE